VTSVSGLATAKINLALVVGPLREDGKHEVLTVLQRLDLADRLTLEPAERMQVRGFPGDTLVHGALAALAAHVDEDRAWRARIDKHIPVAAGLGGGSSDAATALRLANATLPSPLSERELHDVAARLGSDVPFFLRSGPQLGSGDGSVLEPLELPQDFVVLLVIARDARKESSAAVYRAFDARKAAVGFAGRRDALREGLDRVASASDLALLPRNDLASSPLARRLEELGAFRADVSGAGPAVYGLFENRRRASAAARDLRSVGRAVLTLPAWYG
jgi:4-diphosphocytidyl-2-C-methyl-D-erythritol kinase